MGTRTLVTALVMLMTISMGWLASPLAAQTMMDPGDEEAQNAVQPDALHAPNEILVKLREQPSFLAVRRASLRVRGRAVRSFPSIGVQVWRIGPELTVRRAVEELSREEFRDAIEYAEPNWILRAHDIPDDAQFGALWGMHNVGQTGGTADADIDAAEAWSVQTGSHQTVIGIIDSGVDYLHEDLAANMWVNTAETINGIDDDGNGYVDDVRGWDFVNDDNDPTDDYGHGTHTAGTVGAVGNNGIGVAGLNWDVRIMPLKFLNALGNGTTDDAIAAVLYAASFQDLSGSPIVRFTNNSWGGGRRSKSLENAIAASGSLFVASAGNNGNSKKLYPAGYDLDNVISVAATDHDDGLAGFSSYGSAWVDLAAPGVSVLSTLPNDQYGPKNGTSMAAPHVAGVAGLLLAHSPWMTNAEIKAQILGTVDPIAALSGKVLTGGRLNAAAALGVGGAPPDTDPPGAVLDLAVDGLATTHDSVTLNWTAPGDDGNTGTAFLYDVRYATAPILTEADFAAAAQAVGEPAPQPAGSFETYTVTGLLGDTTYSFALKTTDDAGNVAALSNSPQATTPTTPPPPPSDWTFSTVTGSGGTYLGLDFDAFGVPAVAYSEYGNDRVRFALWNGSGWDSETAHAGEYAGVDLAYDAAGRPTITYGWGKLYANEKVGSSWDRTTVQNASRNDVTSVRLDPFGNLGVTYRASGGGGGLRYARRVGGSWSHEAVDSNAATRYMALAYDSAGDPAIAYSDDPDGDGWISALGLAQWNGSGWDLELVDDGTIGYGVFAAIAIDPLTDLPVMMHDGTDTARVVSWDGSAWVGEGLETQASYVSGSALCFAADGTAYAAWVGDGELKLATRAPAASVWDIEVVETGAGAFHLPLRLAPDGTRLYVVYRSGGGVRSAWKAVP